jgi:hypothetical protein
MNKDLNKEKLDNFIKNIGYSDWHLNQGARVYNSANRASVLSVLHAYFARLINHMSEMSVVGWTKKMLSSGKSKCAYRSEIEEDENKSEKALASTYVAAESFVGYVFDRRYWQLHQWLHEEETSRSHAGMQTINGQRESVHKEHLSYNKHNLMKNDSMAQEMNLDKIHDYAEMIRKDKAEGDIIDIPYEKIGQWDYCKHVDSGGGAVMENNKLFNFLDALRIVQSAMSVMQINQHNTAPLYAVCGMGAAEKFSMAPEGEQEVDHTVYRYTDINMVKRRFAHYDILAKEAALSGIGVAGNARHTLPSEKFSGSTTKILNDHLVAHSVEVVNAIAEASYRLDNLGDAGEWNSAIFEQTSLTNKKINNLEESFGEAMFKNHEKCKSLLKNGDDPLMLYAFNVDDSKLKDEEKKRVSYFDTTQVAPSTMLGVEKLYVIQTYVENIEIEDKGVEKAMKEKEKEKKLKEKEKPKETPIDKPFTGNIA